MPYLAPLWCRRPVICLVNHVHTELWSIRFPPLFAAAGRNVERVVMPWVHRRNLFLTVSESTAARCRKWASGRDRIRQICNGVEDRTRRAPRSAGAAVPRARQADRLQAPRPAAAALGAGPAVIGGKLVIAGDGPDGQRLKAMAGPGVVFTGRVSEQEKHRLLCAAWLLMHPALIEGWGIVVAEAAIRGTPAVGVRRARAA